MCLANLISGIISIPKMNLSNRIYAQYEIETAFPVEEAIATMAGEQSSGTFLQIPGETDELKEKSGAQIEWIRETGTVNSPSLPGARTPKGETNPVWRRAQTRVSWPIDNIDRKSVV